jgi:hypothetical protein
VVGDHPLDTFAINRLKFLTIKCQALDGGGIVVVRYILTEESHYYYEMLSRTATLLHTICIHKNRDMQLGHMHTRSSGHTTVHDHAINSK